MEPINIRPEQKRLSRSRDTVNRALAGAAALGLLDAPHPFAPGLNFEIDPRQARGEAAAMGLRAGDCRLSGPRYLSQRQPSKLWNEPKQWHLLAAALLVTLSAVTLTIVRWHWLMRAHDLPLADADALRLGFLGYLLNFVSFGAVGGDLFKAILAARECHGRRTEAVATVILDRLIGLFIVFVLASVAILATGAWRGNTDPWLQAAFRATLICTAVGTVGGGLLLLPDFSRAAFCGYWERCRRSGRSASE